VQDARKQAGLEVSDRIVLMVEGDQQVSSALERYRDYLMNETLASSWQRPPGASAFVSRQEEGDASWSIYLAREGGR
jgi:isoleucyl-tRNA synthetase